jgi:hypothetical protein
MGLSFNCICQISSRFRGNIYFLHWMELIKPGAINCQKYIYIYIRIKALEYWAVSGGEQNKIREKDKIFPKRKQEENLKERQRLLSGPAN